MITGARVLDGHDWEYGSEEKFAMVATGHLNTEPPLMGNELWNPKTSQGAILMWGTG